GCLDDGGNRLTKTSLITHLRDRHCNGEVQAITKHSLLTDVAVFERVEVTFKRMGLWLYGVCFKAHTLRSKCCHDMDFVPPLDGGDGRILKNLLDKLSFHVLFFQSSMTHSSLIDSRSGDVQGFAAALAVLITGASQSRQHDSIVHFDFSDQRLEQTATFSISTNLE
ncbi:hypothetical protein Tco_1130615, partial [Tanacetum coccineum]